MTRTDRIVATIAVLLTTPLLTLGYLALIGIFTR